MAYSVDELEPAEPREEEDCQKLAFGLRGDLGDGDLGERGETPLEGANTAGAWMRG